MQTFGQIVKTLFDDILHEHWGDVVALFLIILGVHLIVLSTNGIVQDTGKSLMAAGLVSLRMKPVPRNGNGHDTEVVTK